MVERTDPIIEGRPRGRMLAERALGPLSDPPSLGATLFMWGLIILIFIFGLIDYAHASRTPPNAPIVYLGGEIMTPDDCYWLANIATDTRTTPPTARVMIARAMLDLNCPVLK